MLHLLLYSVLAAPTVGMNGHLPSTDDSVAMKALGATHVRMDFNWFDFERADGQLDFAYLDPLVDAANANGLSIYATVAYTPKWASSVTTCDDTSTTDDGKCLNKIPVTAKWTEAVTAVVTHYGSKVDCWGIWNEPNLRGFFDGSIDDFVNKVFVPAAQAIRAADPNARICGPELSGLTASSNWNGHNGTCIAGNCIRNGWELDLGQLLKAVGPYLDVVTQHTYQSDATGVMTFLLDGSSVAGVLTHASALSVIFDAGYGAKEVWLTETGWEHPPQGGTSEADVATRIVDLFTKQEQVCAGTYAASANDPWPNWTRTFYYHFPYDPGSGWGLVGPAEAPLLPYTALQTWTMAHSTTACGLGTVMPPDAGIVGDAGVPDAGAPDSGQGPDAGTVADSGSQGSPDASIQQPMDDAGNPQQVADASIPDAGPGSTGGPGDGTMGGCSCSSAPGLGLLLLLAALRRRRSQVQ